MMSKVKWLVGNIEDIQYNQNSINWIKDDIKQNFPDTPENKEALSFFKSQIKDHEQSIKFAIEEMESTLEYKLNLQNISFNDMEVELQAIYSEVRTIEHMVQAWESDDPCEQACNDPGLQYEQGELIEKLWNDFNKKYNTSN